MLWRQGAQKIALSDTYIRAKCTAGSQYTPVPNRQTDRRTDRRQTDRQTTNRHMDELYEHHGNSATIRSNERIAR